MATIERGRRTLKPGSLEDLMRQLRAAGMVERRPAPVVCIDCYRDGGCRDHSRPDEEGGR